MGCTASDNGLQNIPSLAEFTLNRIYVKKELIGQGTYGKVYRCINKIDNQEYALKVVQITAKNREEAQRQIQNLKIEILILKKLFHRNIIKYYSFDISPDNNSVEIVLEYAKGGSLKDYIKKRRFLDEDDVAQKTKSILEGLKYLHSKSFVHRDLKCANILLMQDGTLKITDFGTAKHISVESTEDIANLSASLKGTPFFMAPQILKRTGHAMSADIWSLGCCLIEMLSGKAPWTSLTSNFEEIISYIVNGIHPPYPNNLSEQCVSFLECCFFPAPSQRLKAKQLMKHKFIMDRYHTRKNSEQSNYKTRTLEDYGQEEEDDLEDDYKKYLELQNTKKVEFSKTKVKKYKEIEDYLNDRKSTEAKKVRRPSKKYKKERKENSSFRVNQSKEQIIDDCNEIEIVPHYENESHDAVTKRLFDKEKESIKYVTSTPANIKTPQNIILDQHIEFDQNPIDFPITPQQQNGNKSNSNLDFLKKNQSSEMVINTMISRDQRNRFLESQKYLLQKKQQQKKKWQQQLKQGANYLRKQITKRYIS